MVKGCGTKGEEKPSFCGRKNVFTLALVLESREQNRIVYQKVVAYIFELVIGLHKECKDSGSRQ